MRATRWGAATLAAMATVAALAGPRWALGLGVLLVLLYRWTRPGRPAIRERRAKPRRPLPGPHEPCTTWGYIIPMAEPVTVWVPGYVGITRRHPTERWQDEDHEARMALGLLDYGDAWVGVVGATWAEGRAWEDATITRYAEAGAPLQNVQGMPE